MYMDGCRWMQMGAHGCTSVEEQEKEVWWGKRGEDAHRLGGETSNKNTKNINLSQKKVYRHK